MNESLHNLARPLRIALCISVFVASYTPFATRLAAQSFSHTDTITEYRHKGTYYHDKFEGRKTASGEVFDQNAFTAAHWKFKLGTYLLVTNENNGLQVIVKVNDRCPKHGVLDLSHRAATAIGIRGMQYVRLRVLPDGYEQRRLAQDAMFDSVYSRLNPAPAVAYDEQQPDTAALQPRQPAPSPPRHAATTSPRHPYAQREDDCYRIVLGTVTNHADAYGMIRMLPDIYQERASVETLSDSNDLLVYLDVRIHRTKADDLCRALKRTYPQAKLVACP